MWITSMNFLLFQIAFSNDTAVQKHHVHEFFSHKHISMLSHVDVGNWTYLVDLFIMCRFLSLLKVGSFFSSKTLANNCLFILPSLQTVK